MNFLVTSPPYNRCARLKADAALARPEPHPAATLSTRLNSVMKSKLLCLCVTALCCLPALAYAQASWKLDGNSGTTPGTQFLGTTDTNALELKVNNARVLRLEPGFSPNLIGGHSDNFVPLGIAGVTISGGGQGGSPNQATNDFATIGGGFGNLAGAWTSTIGGGSENSIQFESTFSTIGGGSG